MLLVPALLSKNPRFIKSTTTKNGYQAVFSHSLLLNENTPCGLKCMNLPHYNGRIDILYGVIVKEYRILVH